jgi:TRAP-type transport system small permease protein
MTGWRTVRDSILNAIAFLEEFVGMVLIVAMAVIINLQIILRYLFNHPLIWPEEVSRLLLVWMTFIGAAVLVRRRTDIAIDTFVEMMPIIPRRAALVVGDVVMIVLSAFVAYEGVKLVDAVSGIELMATGLPTALIAWPLVFGSVLTVVHASVNLVYHWLEPDPRTVLSENVAL